MSVPFAAGQPLEVPEEPAFKVLQSAVDATELCAAVAMAPATAGGSAQLGLCDERICAGRKALRSLQDLVRLGAQVGQVDLIRERISGDLVKVASELDRVGYQAMENQWVTLPEE